MNAGGAGTDFSSTAAFWEIRPSSTELVSLTRMIILIEDAGTFATDGYGATTALSNGIQITKVRGTGSDPAVQYRLTDAELPITVNLHWAAYCYDSRLDEFGTGGATNFLVARWTFSRFGEDIWLDGAQNEALRITLNDSFLLLVSQFFMLEGKVSGTNQLQ